MLERLERHVNEQIGRLESGERINMRRDFKLSSLGYNGIGLGINRPLNDAERARIDAKVDDLGAQADKSGAYFMAEIDERLGTGFVTVCSLFKKLRPPPIWNS